METLKQIMETNGMTQEEVCNQAVNQLTHQTTTNRQTESNEELVNRTMDMLLQATTKLCSNRKKKFIARDEIIHAMKEIALWMRNENKCWIELSGRAGNGKTTLAKATYDLLVWKAKFSGAIIEHYPKFMSSNEIAELACDDKGSFFSFEDIKRSKVLFIDDLGTEPTVITIYGRNITPLVDLLEYRYDKYLQTFYTTNLDKEQIETKYGERVFDRFREMVKRIPFKGNSFRGNQ